MVKINYCGDTLHRMLSFNTDDFYALGNRIKIRLF